MKIKKLTGLEYFFNLVRNVVVVKLMHRPTFDARNLAHKWYCPVEPVQTSSEPVITWIGQSAFLIQIDGVNILTDPHFFDTLPMYTRLVPPGIPLDELPKIHVIAISHNHIDHMDKRSLLAIKHHKPLILAPKGDGKWFLKKGFKNVIENKWGDTYKIDGSSGKPIKFSYLPANHSSGRYFLDFNKSTYGSWMIEHDDHTIYFAGDSSHGPHFAEIAKDFQNIETALMPIGPVEPRSTVEHAHLDGSQAVQAFIELGAKQFIPMHWGTFQFGVEDFLMPITILEQFWKKNLELLKDKTLTVLRFGERKKLPLTSILKEHLRQINPCLEKTPSNLI